MSGIAASVFWRYLITKPSGQHLVYSLLDVCRAGGGHFFQTSKKERSCSKMGVVVHPTNVVVCCPEGHGEALQLHPYQVMGAGEVFGMMVVSR